MTGVVLVENINLFDLINGIFIIGSQQINLYIGNIEKYNTPYTLDMTKFVSNSCKCGDKITKTSDSINIVWGSNIASHGIIYPEVLSIDASTKYLMISYKTSGSIPAHPFIRDEFNNTIYWIYNKSRLLYKKIELDPNDPTCQTHTYLISIPDDPTQPIEKFNLYLLGTKIVPGGTTYISDLKVIQVSKLPKITINISI
jgi:hypothetical protein